MKLKIGTLFWLCYFAIGAALAIAAPFMAGKADLPVDMVVASDGGDAHVAYKATQVEEAAEIYANESKQFSPSETALGIAAFTIALNSSQARWSAAALDHFEKTEKQNEASPILTAYRGSSYGLAARDYPITGALLAFPGPGFVRIYNIMRAKSLLNKAVADSNSDPIVLLLRASSFSGFPGLFGTKDIGFADFKVLLSVVSDPANTSEFTGTATFGIQVLTNYALALEDNERGDDAKAIWTRLKTDYPGTPEAKVAKSKLK